MRTSSTSSTKPEKRKQLPYASPVDKFAHNYLRCWPLLTNAVGQFNHLMSIESTMQIDSWCRSGGWWTSLFLFSLEFYHFQFCLNGALWVIILCQDWKCTPDYISMASSICFISPFPRDCSEYFDIEKQFRAT